MAAKKRVPRAARRRAQAGEKREPKIREGYVHPLKKSIILSIKQIAGPEQVMRDPAYLYAHPRTPQVLVCVPATLYIVIRGALRVAQSEGYSAELLVFGVLIVAILYTLLMAFLVTKINQLDAFIFRLFSRKIAPDYAQSKDFLPIVRMKYGVDIIGFVLSLALLAGTFALVMRAATYLLVWLLELGSAALLPLIRR